MTHPQGDEQTRQIYQRAGFTGGVGFGRHPAVLVVDFQVGFTDPERSPLASDCSREVENTARVVAEAHRRGVPVVFTAIAYEPNLRDAGLWIKKAPSLQVLRLGSDLAALDPRLPAGPQDTLVIKKYASAFFGTSLAATLTAAGVDTVLVAGATTSGCVRASVVDALQYGFRPIVLSDAVADRAEGPHQANLFDMGSKYADLASTEDALAYLRELPPDVEEEAGGQAGHGPR